MPSDVDPPNRRDGRPPMAAASPEEFHAKLAATFAVLPEGPLYRRSASGRIIEPNLAEHMRLLADLRDAGLLTEAQLAARCAALLDDTEETTGPVD